MRKLLCLMMIFVSVNNVFAKHELRENVECRGPTKMSPDVYREWPENSIKLNVVYDSLFKNYDVTLNRKKYVVNGFWAHEESRSGECFYESINIDNSKGLSISLFFDCDSGKVEEAQITGPWKDYLFFECH